MWSYHKSRTSVIFVYLYSSFSKEFYCLYPSKFPLCLSFLADTLVPIFYNSSSLTESCSFNSRAQRQWEYKNILRHLRCKSLRSVRNTQVKWECLWSAMEGAIWAALFPLPLQALFGPVPILSIWTMPGISHVAINHRWVKKGTNKFLMMSTGLLHPENHAATELLIFLQIAPGARKTVRM